MSGKLIGSLVYLFLLTIVAALFVPVGMLAALVLTMLVSILSTITDEAAQYGAQQFHGKETWQRICVNIHWALSTFYLAVIGVGISSTALPKITYLALILTAISFLAGTAGALVIRRFGRGGALMAAISLPLAVAFSIYATRQGLKM